jgi:hypothetical protein
MKSFIAALMLAISFNALSFDPVYPTKNIRYVNDRDYRTEVLDSDKYVVMVFSSDECLERTIIDRSCWLFERKLDYFVPKFSSKVKVIGFNTFFENYGMVRDFNIIKKPTVIIMINGKILKRFEPVFNQPNPNRIPRMDWQDTLLKEVLDVVGQIR